MKETTIPLLGIMVVLVGLTLSLMVGLRDIKDRLDVADIAGTRVPPVSCQEDEAIWWLGVDRLGCVHFEEVR